jgi:hypothetical protein
MIIQSQLPLISSGGRRDKMPRHLRGGLALGCFQAIISSKEIID